MRFGVFDHVDRNAQVPLGTFYADRLALVEEYDRSGFYGYHVAEHHATPLSLAPSPSVYLSAVAQRTKQLRFGPLVYTLPLYHPIRLLDEICMLDQMSGGRLLLGIGRGISPLELRYWGLDPETGPEQFAEARDLILRGLQADRLNFEGKYYSFHDFPIEIPPVQKPFPSLWYGLSRPETIGWCVEHNVNVVTNMAPQPTRQITDRYRAAWQSAGRPESAMPMMGFTRHLVIAGTDKEAYEIARPNYARWRDSFLELWKKHDVYPPNVASLAPETLEGAEELGRAVIGSPQKVRAIFASQIEESRVNYVLCRFAFGDIARDEALQSVRLFTREVMPAFQ